MTRLALAATVAAMLTFVGSAEAACTKTWLLGAAAGNWSTGANWSGNTSPAPTDDVCIPAGSGPVTFDVAAADVRSLQLARTLTLSASSLLTVTGTGATNTSQLTDTASVTGPDGILAYAPGATVEKVGAGTTTITSDIDFDGAVNIDAGTLALGLGSDSANANGGTFTLAGGTTFAVGVGGFGTHSFDGTITDGAADATFSSASGNSVTISGTYAVHTTATAPTTNILNLMGPDISLDVLELNGGTIDGNAGFSIAEALNWTTGTLAGSGITTIPSGAVLDFEGSGGKVLSRTLVNDSATTTVLDATGLTVNGTLDNEAGTTFRLPDDQDIGGSGAFRVKSGATLEKLGAGTSTLTPDIDFDGTVDIDAGTLALGIGSDSVNVNSGTFTLAGGTTFAIGEGGFGTHIFNGTITDGAADATVSSASGNSVTISGTYAVHTTATAPTTNLLEFNGTGIDIEVLELNGGTIGGGASYTIAEALNWTTGTLAGGGTVTVPTGAVLDFLGTGGKVLSQTLVNESATTTVLDATGLIVNGTLDNRAGTIFRLPDDQDIGGSGELLVPSGATLEKLGAGTATLTPDIDFDGAVDIDAGTLALGIGADSVDTNSGTFTLADGTTFLIGEGGFGTHAFDGTITDGAGDATVTTASGNGVTIGGTYAVHLTSTTPTANILNFDGTGISLEVLDLDGGTIGGDAVYPVTETLIWRAGTLAGTGTTTIADGATVTFPTATAKSVTESRVLRNESASFTPPADSTLFVNSPARIDNAGTLTFADDRDIGGGGTVRNLAGGTLRKTAGAGAPESSTMAALENAGTAEVAQGVLQVSGGVTNTGTLTIDAGATLDPGGPLTQTAGTLSGAGTLDGDAAVSGGAVAPGASPGVLTITGNYTQGEDATLAVELDGTTPGTQFDQLAVGGAASLDGDVAVDRDPAFVPANSAIFQFLTSASRTGTFDAVTGGALSGGRSLALVYPSTAPFGARLVVDLPSPPTAGTPTISGTPAAGQTLTCNTGTWTGGPTFAFQWLRDGQPIEGATSQTYLVADGDRGHAIACRVTGTNGAGSTSATSAAVNVPAPVVEEPTPTPTTPPVATDPPPAPAPPAPPAPPATPPTTTPAATPQEEQLAAAPPAAVAQALGFPARACLSRRRFTIRLREPRGVRLASARVTVAGKRVTARRRGGRMTAIVNLRGLPRGRYSVRIVALTTSGKTLTGTRRYRTCGTKRRRGSVPPL